MDPDPGSDLICDTESHTTDIFCKAIRILLQDSIYSLSVFLIDFCAELQRYPVFLEKDHSAAHICFLRHLFCDLHGLFFADSLDLSQPLRFFLHNTHGIIAETTYDPGCQCRTDPFDRAGTQITFHGQCILRHFFYVGGYLKLFTIHRMCCIISGSFNGSPLGDCRKCSHTGQFLFLFHPFQYHDRISIIFIPEDHMIYISCNCLTHFLLHL